jgi:hypothetical protein
MGNLKAIAASSTWEKGVRALKFSLLFVLVRRNGSEARLSNLSLIEITLDASDVGDRFRVWRYTVKLLNS